MSLVSSEMIKASQPNFAASKIDGININPQTRTAIQEHQETQMRQEIVTGLKATALVVAMSAIPDKTSHAASSTTNLSQEGSNITSALNTVVNYVDNNYFTPLIALAAFDGAIDTLSTIPQMQAQIRQMNESERASAVKNKQNPDTVGKHRLTIGNLASNVIAQATEELTPIVASYGLVWGLRSMSESMTTAFDAVRFWGTSVFSSIVIAYAVLPDVIIKPIGKVIVHKILPKTAEFALNLIAHGTNRVSRM